MTLPAHEAVPSLDALGVVAFTTTRAAGSFGTLTEEPVRLVTDRWASLQDSLSVHGSRLATARQVHGDGVIVHEAEWEGWLRAGPADGHAAFEPGTAMAVTIADCVPVFLAHSSGAAALLHSGWKGTAARIIERAITLFVERGLVARELVVHLGPSICGRCYEVSPDVHATLTGIAVDVPTPVDLRALIASHAMAAGVRHISISESCTRCDNDRFFSHRAGDAGRQLGVMVVPRS